MVFSLVYKKAKEIGANTFSLNLLKILMDLLNISILPITD
jgi:hypothetical protein